MSITISDCNEICNSPSNQSTAKMLYTFSKQIRFGKRKQILCDKFYDSKSINQIRTRNFGFGQKYDFTKDGACSPPPNTYNLQDDFRSTLKTGFGFGKGRQQMQVTGPFVASKKNKNPGPGSYELPSMLEKNSFAFHEKLNSLDHSTKLVPGPGTYPVSFTINERGRYFLAKYKNSCVRDFSKSQGRCQTSQQRSPGPGAYTTQAVDLSPKGKYASSKLHNCLTRKFGSSLRGNLGERTNTPGPGNYKLPSQFGYYEDKKHFERSNNFKANRSSTTVDKQNVAQSHSN